MSWLTRQVAALESGIGRVKAFFNAPARDDFLSAILNSASDRASFSFENAVEKALASNPVVWSCQQRKINNIGELKFQQVRDGEVVENDRLNMLLSRPNPRNSMTGFLADISLDLDLLGEAYIQGVNLDSARPEFNRLRPDRVKVETADDGAVSGYAVKNKNGKVVANLDKDEVLQLTGHNPLDSTEGISPTEAVWDEICTYSKATDWNWNMLDNNGAPSLLMKLQGDKPLNEEQIERVKKSLKENWGGEKNAGMPQLVNAGVEVQNISKDAKDLDWLDGKRDDARTICAAYGVPPELVGDTQSKTLANFEVAERILFTETLVPWGKHLAEELTNWLQGAAEDWSEIEIQLDTSDIEALKDDQTEEIKALEQATFLKINEKRERIGLDPVDGGDQILVPVGKVPLGASTEGDQMPETED